MFKQILEYCKIRKAKIYYWVKGAAQVFQTEEKYWFVALLLILTNILSYVIGRTGKIEEQRAPVAITAPTSTSVKLFSAAPFIVDARIVASKSGKKYYFAWCGGVNNINAENRIYFENKAEAERAGLTRAANCDEKP